MRKNNAVSILNDDVLCHVNIFVRPDCQSAFFVTFYLLAMMFINGWIESLVIHIKSS